MSIPQWALVAGVKGIINDAEKDGKVAGAAKSTNELLTAFFPGEEKAIKFGLVKSVIIPFVKYLLKDDAEGYAQIKQTL